MVFMATCLEDTEGREESTLASGSWLIPATWGAGTAIYVWLLIGVFSARDYRLDEENIDWVGALRCVAVSVLASLGCGLGVYWLLRDKYRGHKKRPQLWSILVTVIPAVFFISALAALILTLTTYNGDWKDARQGIATAFASLIAAVGVVVSVVVTYKTGEENRQAQEKNLKTQLDYQREEEEKKRELEGKKQDSELIKNLNDRLHDIIERRYSEKPQERSASYFQLAALYQDWELLSKNSETIRTQRDSQQRNILKILFGAYQAEVTEEQTRTDLEVQSLNSVIKDLFARPRESRNGRDAYDLTYLDLRSLDFLGSRLEGASLGGAHLEGANLRRAHLEGASLGGAHLEGADLSWAHLEGADLSGAHLKGATVLRWARLEGAVLRWACLEGADLSGAHLEGAFLIGAHLEGASLDGANLENSDLSYSDISSSSLAGAKLVGAVMKNTSLERAVVEEAFFFYGIRPIVNEDTRNSVIQQLKVVAKLPSANQLLKALGGDEELFNQIVQSHREYQGQKEN